MSDLESELRELFHDMRTRAPSAKPLSEYLADPVAKTSRRWQWAVVPAAVAATAAVVVGVAALPYQHESPPPVVAGSPSATPSSGEQTSGEGQDWQAVTDVAQLEGKWRAESLFGEPITQPQGPLSHPVDVVFSELDAGWWWMTDDGCNTTSGRISVSSSQLSTGQAGTTLVGCFSIPGQTDHALNVKAIGAADQARIASQVGESAKLSLLSKGKVVAVYISARSAGLVEDVENPSAVVSRAKALLGDRYVDVSINADHTAYIVGVLDLKPDEAQRLGEQLSGPAPVVVAPRAVTAQAVMVLRRQIEQLVQGLDSSIEFTVLGSNPADGSVLVGVSDEESLAGAGAFLRSQLPDWDVVDRGTRTIRLATTSQSDPQIVVRVLPVTDGSLGG